MNAIIMDPKTVATVPIFFSVIVASKCGKLKTVNWQMSNCKCRKIEQLIAKTFKKMNTLSVKKIVGLKNSRPNF